jgi:hypothetical protein
MDLYYEMVQGKGIVVGSVFICETGKLEGLSFSGILL